MRIKLDRKYIENYQMERVKSDVKFFSEVYALSDLRIAFESQVGIDFGYNPEILKAEISAMDSGWATGNKTIFYVYMVVDGGGNIYKIRFYIDMDLNVDTGDLVGFNGAIYGKMYDVEKFKLES